MVKIRCDWCDENGTPYISKTSPSILEVGSKVVIKLKPEFVIKCGDDQLTDAAMNEMINHMDDKVKYVTFTLINDDDCGIE